MEASQRNEFRSIDTTNAIVVPAKTRAQPVIAQSMPASARMTLLRACAVIALTLAPAFAQSPIAEFYRGRTLDMIVGTTTGNDFDNRGRLLAKHMGKHIPGNPAILARNMPGGGGVIAMNWLANLAPRDGTAMHMVFPAMGTLQATGATGVNFDLRKFGIVGNTTDSPNVLVVWRATGARSIEDAKKMQLVLGSAPGNTGVYYAAALNEMIGTKFKVVSGYPGGAEINLAMERGEIDGRASNTWASFKETNPDWVRDKKIIALFQVGVKRHVDLPDVPLMTELVTNEDDRKVLAFFSASVAINRAVVTAPGAPPARLEALRRAFDATMRDSEFLADAEKTGLDISPMSGEAAQVISDGVINAPTEIVARAKTFMENP